MAGEGSQSSDGTRPAKVEESAVVVAEGETDVAKDKDIWDKAQAIGAVAGALVVPLIVLLFGHLLSQSLRQGETKARLIEVAVDVLKTDPKNTETVPGLRDWAVKVINRYSEEPLPDESAKELLTKSFPVTAGQGAGCCVSCAGVTVCGRSVKLSCGSCEAANP